MGQQTPVTRYARNGPVHIAYQAVGTGPTDLVYIPGIFTHVEHQWEEPSYARFLGRLASFTRLILLDQRLLPGQEAEYRRRHAAVWPEMLDALKAAGARDYSIFLHGIDLFAYLEVDDIARFRERMAATEVNDRWQAEMAELIDPLTDPETGFHQRLEEIFHLD